MIETTNDFYEIPILERRDILNQLSEATNWFNTYLGLLYSSEEFDQTYEVEMSQHRKVNCFHASALNYYLQCSRRAWYDLHGAPKSPIDAKLAKIFNTGHAFHGLFQYYLEEIVKLNDHRIPLKEFTEEIPVWDGDLKLSGHVDGLGYVEDSIYELIRIAVEIKTMNDASWRKAQRENKPHDYHIPQAAAYCRCLPAPIMLFVYINKNDSQVLTIPWVYDPKRWKPIEDTLRKVLAADEIPIPTRNWKCRDCPYYEHCNTGKRQRRRM